MFPTTKKRHITEFTRFRPSGFIQIVLLRKPTSCKLKTLDGISFGGILLKQKEFILLLYFLLSQYSYSQQKFFTNDMLIDYEWGPINKVMGVFLDFNSDGSFQMHGKYPMGAAFKIKGNYSFNNGKPILYPNEIFPNYGNIDYTGQAWNLIFRLESNNLWFQSSLIQELDNGSISTYYNYEDPVPLGTVREYNGIEVERMISEGFINDKDVFVRDLPTL